MAQIRSEQTYTISLTNEELNLMIDTLAERARQIMLGGVFVADHNMTADIKTDRNEARALALNRLLDDLADS